MSEQFSKEQQPGAAKRQRRGSIENIKSPHRSRRVSELEKRGWTVIPIELEGIDELRDGLLKGTGEYFSIHLPEEARDPVRKALRTESSNETVFDFRDIETYKRLMDPGWRKDKLEPAINRMVRSALSGNQFALAKPGRVIARTGFAIYTHLRGIERAVADYFPKAIRMLQEEIAPDLRPTSIGHLLFKPPIKSGGSLKPHIDGGTMAEAFESISQNPETSIEDWMRPHRVQVLLHIDGGRNGATNALSPMTIPRLGFVFGTICPQHLHSDLPSLGDVWNKSGGPIMYDWYNKKVLAVLNRLMKVMAGLEKAQLSDGVWLDGFAKAKPAFYKFLTSYFLEESKNGQLIPFTQVDMVPDGPERSFLVVWPGQFIHGSSNTGGSTRLSLTIPSGFGEKDIHTDRALARLQNMATGNWDAVRADVEPYFGGSVHKENIIEVENYELLKDLYVTPSTDLSELRSLFRTGSAHNTQVGSNK